MSEKLTWSDIRSRYPNEWVVLVDYAIDENENIADGVVYEHGADRRQVFARCADLSKQIAVRYTGEIRGGRIGLYREDLDEAG